MLNVEMFLKRLEKQSPEVFHELERISQMYYNTSLFKDEETVISKSWFKALLVVLDSMGYEVRLKPHYDNEDGMGGNVVSFTRRTQ